MCTKYAVEPDIKLFAKFAEMSVDALVIAAGEGNTLELNRLLENGSPIDGFHTTRKMTALMRASYEGHEDAVRLLISRGAKVNLVDQGPFKWTALIIACDRGHVSVAEILLRSGADYTLKYNNGSMALDMCKGDEIRAQIQAVISSLPARRPSSSWFGSFSSRTPPPLPQTPKKIPSTPPSSAPSSRNPSPAPLRVNSFMSNTSESEQLAAVTLELHSLRQQLEDRTRDLEAEKDSLKSQLAETTAERDSAVTTRDQLSAERTQLVSERDSLRVHLAERDSSIEQSLREQLADRTREQEALVAERDGLTTQLAGRTAERDTAVATRDQLYAERTQLVSERDSLKAQLAEKDSMIEQFATAGAGAGTLAGVAVSAFERYHPHMFVPSLVPCCKHPGIHDVSENSALFRTCSSLSNVGGSWIPAPGPVAGFKLVAVQAVVHEDEYYKGFESKQNRITKQRQTGGDYFNSNTGSMNAGQLLVLSALREQFLERAPGTVSKGANSFYCYHGPRAEHVGSICSTGMVATGAMDAGFFGCGCYMTLNMEYALRYARGDFDADGGPRLAPGSRYPIIMFAATTGMAYPVTPGPNGDYGHNQDPTAPAGTSDFFGKPLKRGFDCHVVCVSLASSFQAVERNQCQYVEVVIENEAQLLPVAVLWFEDLNRF